MRFHGTSGAACQQIGTRDTKYLRRGASGHGDGVEVVSIPFVFKYLTNELAAMNIKTTLRV